MYAEQNFLNNGDTDMTSTDLSNHKVVSLNEWLEARKQFLIQEKEFTRLRDQLISTMTIMCHLPLKH